MFVFAVIMLHTHRIKDKLSYCVKTRRISELHMTLRYHRASYPQLFPLPL